MVDSNSSNCKFIDTHCHLDGEEFNDDRDAVVQRAREAGCTSIFLPAIDLASCQTVLDTCKHYPDFCYPMLGLHPEEVKSDWKEQLEQIRQIIKLNIPLELCSLSKRESSQFKSIAIGEVGLDYYWSREFEQEQLLAFEEQVRWSVELNDLSGGVFHCFTGNEQEARQLLEFDRFVLGIGGVLTFKKSHLPEVLSACVPLSRIVLETDAPYMAPVPLRGQRNESSYIVHMIDKLAETYGVSAEEICQQTNGNVARIFSLKR